MLLPGLIAVGALGGMLAAFHHYALRLTKARKWLSRGAVLVDVDSTGDFAREHPRVAINVPLEDLPRRAHELGDLDKPLVVFAHSWWRGLRAVQSLRESGFREVMSAAGLSTKETLSAEVSRADQARRKLDQVELAPER